MLTYFDNAATSFPKPPGVLEGIIEFQTSSAANPGRSGHRMSLEAGRVLLDARDRLADLFGIRDSMRIVFTMNATMAINIALRGLLKSGDHVVTTSMEHNSLARPLRWAESIGVELSVVTADSETGRVSAADIEAALRPATKLVAMTHASNVTGSIMPVAEVGAITRQRGLTLLVDCAQTAGSVPIDVEKMGIDLLAFTGHKSLLGPMGTGGLFVSSRIDLDSLVRGGTGSRSEEDVQPEFMPDRLESGTPNAIGIAGLVRGLEFIEQTGLHEISARERALMARFLDGASGIERVRIFGSQDLADRIAIVPLNIDGVPCSEVAQRLDDDHDIMVRAGLHCAPWAHSTIGTFPEGTVRFSFGHFNTEEEIDAAIDALTRIAS